MPTLGGINMICLLRPSVQRKVWGGTKLANYKNILEKNDLPIGETWEVSTHADGPSFLPDGTALKYPYDKLPYLVKFIDTGEALSIQVHPGDDYARKHEGSSGKSECWLIIESLPGAGIYLGLKPGVSKEVFKAALEAKVTMAMAINDYLNFYEVRAGDFFYVPPGAIHAIGAGVTLAEIQQNSGITYRVWDWNRGDECTGENKKPRELHIAKALDVINFNSDANLPAYFRMTRNLFQSEIIKKKLIDNENFEVTLYNLLAHQSLEIECTRSDRLVSLLNITRKLKINSTLVDPMSAVLIENEKKFYVESLGGSSFLVIE